MKRAADGLGIAALALVVTGMAPGAPHGKSELLWPRVPYRAGSAPKTSPAPIVIAREARAGLKRGDIITKVTLSVLRSSQRLTVWVRLAEAPGT